MLQPLAKRILIECAEHKKDSALLMLKEDPKTLYKVLAIGDEITKVFVGDLILVDHYAVSPLKYKENEYQMIHEDNIHAKVIQ